MLYTYIFISIAVFIIVLEVPSLYKEKLYKEIIVFTIILMLGVYLGMVQLHNWPFYNPLNQLVMILSE